MTKARWWVVVQFFLLGLLGLLCFSGPRSGLIAWSRPIGPVLLAVGCLLILVAYLTFRSVNGWNLGIAPVPKASDSLVDRGIFAHIRHPIYLGVMLASFGVALLSASLDALVVAFCLVVFFVLKARYEEGQLTRKFPDYSSYQSRTGPFFPRLFASGRMHKWGGGSG